MLVDKFRADEEKNARESTINTRVKGVPATFKHNRFEAVVPMRIPSQFNEDNLFRRRNRRNESAQTYRKLLRLVIGLTLVMMVMRQASRPAVYQPFFGQPISAAGEASPQTQVASGIGFNSGSSSGDGIKVKISPEDREVANWLTSELPPTDQRQWVVALTRWQSGHPIEQLPLSVDLVVQKLNSRQSISDQQRLAWKVLLDSLLTSSNQAAAEQSASHPTSLDRPRIAAFLAALDDAAASRVVDGSVWRSGDFDLFYRYLDQASSLSGEGVATSGVLPLLQQPDVFRNQLVRASGTVARTERITAKENPYGISEYWQLWIRPDDGADRPLVAVVPAVPALVESVGPNAIVEEGPQITVVGRFLKRLAYQSSLGADLAPVVVGRIVLAPITEDEIAAADQGRGIQTDSTSRTGLWLTVAAACLVGLALAGITMWRTSVMAKRARQLRNDNRKDPNDFLRTLKHRSDQQTHEPEPNHEAGREASG